MKKNILIDWSKIKTESDFHKMIAERLGFGPYYGENTNALWDMLTSGMGNNVVFHITNSSEGKKNMKEDYDQILFVLNEAKKYGLENNLENWFDVLIES